MRMLDIRLRMLLAALLPVVLISTLLAVFFVFVRFDDTQESHLARTRSLARQLALASEYGLFSANETQLQSLVQGALREPDVRWVAVLDGRGNRLVSAGDETGMDALAFDGREGHGVDALRGLDLLSQPVFASGLKLDDVYEDVAMRAGNPPRLLGQIRVTFSRQSLNDRRQTMMLLGAVIGGLGLLFGMVLAAYLSGGVIRPIMRISALIERIGQGDFAAVKEARSQALTQAGDPLHDLQHNLYRMADRLAFARDDLEHQVILATQALRQKKDEAELANMAKSRFLAAASHDLRQPTHALGMFVARLTQLKHDTQTRTLIDQLEASVRAMQNLLDGLLDISRLEAQSVTVNKRPFALGPLLLQLQHDLERTAADKGLRLRIRPSLLWVHSDATLVYRVLLNLASNALRYTERGGVLIAARLSDGGRQVLLQVWDSGIGIAPEHHEAVFKEFYQVANSARDRTKGLGLGLNIVQRTVELLGHPLAMVSALGQGTRFSLSLPPAAAQAGLGAPVVAENSSADDLHDVVALVVEDDELVRAALAALLGGWGLRVFEANGWLEAVQLIESGCRPQVIISDYRLQDGYDGIEVVRCLRGLLNTVTPACLMSGNTDAALMLAAKNAGLTLLHKPVRPAKLRSLLRRLLIHPLPDQRDDDLP
jgi:signal transduction histidine kinase